MRILIVAEYPRCLPTSPARWVGLIAEHLLRRGHEVRLALDGTDDASLVSKFETSLFRPLRTHLGAEPRAFARWAAKQAAHADACLSLTGIVRGDVTLALEPRASRAMLRLARGLKPHSALLEIAHRPWLPLVALAERRPTPIRRVRGADPIRASFGGDQSTGVRGLGFASRFDPPAGSPEAMADLATDALRAHARALLEIPACSRTLLWWSLRGSGAQLAEFARALSPIMARERDLHLVIAHADLPALRALPAGLDAARLRVLGGTEQVPALVRAADLVAAGPGDRGPEELAPVSPIADALRQGRPALALGHWPGCELLINAGPPGAIVESPAHWGRTLEAWLEPAKLAQGREAAMAMAPSLCPAALVDRLLALFPTR
ncbi:MAG: hypothetical protein SFY95_07140 [Planctomycetota bacterium]|nr:hypothetical protein [Planctomycetota bacterium]